jgi:ADP-ribose pyrophosphatase
MSDETIETVYAGKFLQFKKKGKWEFVERDHCTGVVAVLAITETRELVLVEQFRPAIGKRIIELPAGLAGDIEGEGDETLEASAKRELLEETGYSAESMEYLTQGPSSAGLTTEIITFFRALGLHRVNGGGGTGGEDIAVHVVPMDRLTPWLQERLKQGCLIDYKLYAALCFEKR